MKFFDLHCDTADEIFLGKKSLYDGDCHVSLKKAEGFDKYVQLFAVFTYPDLDDNAGYEQFLKIRENFLSECGKHGVEMIYSSADLERFNNSDKKIGAVLTVEDSRILDGKIERVRELYDLGVRVMTLLWGGDTSIGGSHDTNNGLTDFGKAAVEEMAKVGSIPDISHASFKSADDIMDICEKCGVSPIATHINSYTVCPHSRNLTDERFMRLTKLGGVAGVSLCTPHLVAGFKRGDKAALDVIVPHFKKYEELVPSHVCFGGDMDGTSLPEGISGLDEIPKAVNLLRGAGFSEKQLDEITFDTAYGFMKKNLPSK